MREGITGIKWSVYGKSLEITRTSTAANPVQKITYTYDAQGNRISKAVLKNTGTTSYTWYTRDAQGNVMSTYSSSGGAADLGQLPLNVSERHIYGSSRLGMYSKLLNVDNGPKDMADSNSVKYYRGYRQYELSNHLGNVLATVSDKKKGVDTDSDGIIEYYDADVTTAQDYYPFGMLMPGRIGYQSQGGWVSEPGASTRGDNGLPSEISIDNRTNNLPPEYTATSSVELNPGFESGSGDIFLAYISEDDGSGSGGGEEGSSLNGAYRYGFNGKENDNEVKGTGNQQDYGARIYDPRIGRFLSTDPLAKSFAWYSPYQFAGNMPIAAIDLDGEEQKIMINWYDASGNVGRTKIVKGDFNNVNALYQSLKGGLNTQTTYDLEGTKFNSTNAIFTSGFDDYKKGGPTRNPDQRIRPNNGTLTFNIYSSGTVLINYTNEAINERELYADALRGVSKVGNVAGTSIEGAGYVTSMTPGGQSVGVPLIGIGKGIGLVGDGADITADLVEGKKGDAVIKTGVAIGQYFIGEGAKKLPIREVSQQAIDTYVGRGVGAIKDGYLDNRAQEVEVSNKLNIQIEEKK